MYSVREIKNRGVTHHDVEPKGNQKDGGHSGGYRWHKHECLNAAHRMDTVGNKVAKTEIAMIKVAVPNMACQVVDWSIQAHGGGGTSNDFGLTHAYAMARVLRLADGPDEVHNNQIGKLELKKYR